LDFADGSQFWNTRQVEARRVPVWPLAAIAMAFIVTGGIIDAAIYLH
jgi:hypothetical protein